VIHKIASLSVLVALVFTAAGCAIGQSSGGTGAVSPRAGADWKHVLAHHLQLLGHRNWIVVADSAYPLQSRPGITTIYTDESQIDTVKYVLQKIDASGHVAPLISVDQELASVPEADAKGIDAYRAALKETLAGRPVKTAPHIDIIKSLDESAKLFNVVVLKTDLKIPYTSVFIQLECAYWNADKESRLRGEAK
jgi:hypothetical protein